MKTLRTANLTFWIGALLFGGVISLLHLQLNRLTDVREAFSVLAFCMVLYGAASGAAGVMGAISSTLARLLSSTLRKKKGESTQAPAAEEVEAATYASLVPALLFFQLPFWVIAWLYGRTYDQTPPFEFTGPLGMALYLLAGSVCVAGVVTLVCFAVAGCFSRHPKPFTRILFFVGGLLLGPHFLLPATYLKQQRLQRTIEPIAIESISSAPEVSALEVAEQTAGRDEENHPTEAGFNNQPLGDTAGSNRLDPDNEPAPKVLLIGFDGADPAVTQRLIDEGQLPTFKRLKAEGTWSELETLPHANSAVIWATIYSGARRTDHGVLDFYRISLPGLETGIFPVHRTFFKEACDFLAKTRWVDQTLITAADMRRPTLWQVVDHAGQSLGVIDGYFYSFPALTPAHQDSWFIAYGSDGFERQLESGSMSLDELKLFVQPRNVYPGIKSALPQDDFLWQSETLLTLLETRTQPQFVNFYTHEPDSIQHQSWSQIEPEKYLGSRPAPNLEDSQIAATYRRFDSFLARLLATVSKETSILIVSDHGHVPTLVHKLETQHRHGPPGILLGWGPAFKKGSNLDKSHVLDIFPTVLHILGLPLPEDGRGQVLRNALTEAYSGDDALIESYRFLVDGNRQSVQRNSILNQQEIEKLKRLGYL